MNCSGSTDLKIYHICQSFSMKWINEWSFSWLLVFSAVILSAFLFCIVHQVKWSPKVNSIELNLTNGLCSLINKKHLNKSYNAVSFEMSEDISCRIKHFNIGVFITTHLFKLNNIRVFSLVFIISEWVKVSTRCPT